jgi:hypothetical protein
VYHLSVLNEKAATLTPTSDPHCLATLKHYRSLIPMAQEARAPIFALTPAQGAIGSHAVAVHEAYGDFQGLAGRILSKISEQSELLPAPAG